MDCRRQKGARALTSDLDIYRAANLLIQQYGANEAPLIAAKRADALLSLGEMDGQRAWKAVVAALEELTRSTRAPGEHLN